MKKIISSIFSVLLFGSAISTAAFSYGSAIDEKSDKISAELSESMVSSALEVYPVWIVLTDNDKPDFRTLATEEIHPKTEEEMEKFYALSEDERTELMRSAMLSIVKKYYSEKNQRFLTEMNISSDCVKAMSEMTSTMVLTLNKEQITELAKSELVESMSLYDNEIPTESFTDEADKLTKEEFLDMVVSETEDFSNGGFVYRGDLKFDAIPNGGGWNLVIYGIKEEDYEPNIKLKEGAVIRNYKEYMGASAVAFWSGSTESIESMKPNDNPALDRFKVIYYVENVLPGFSIPRENIVEASRNMTYDVAKYIYPEITKGDINDDGAIDASDASLVLSAYSYIMIGEQMALNSELFDWNNDGAIDSVDASNILQKYAENSTS